MTMPPSTHLQSVISGRSHATNRARGVGAFVGSASAAVVLTGCGLQWPGTLTADEPEVQSYELDEADDRPCPEELPIGDDPSGHGFGVQGVADESPTLLSPNEAWVCQYDPFDASTTTSHGAIYEWRRTGQPTPVASGDLPRLRNALGGLVPADRSEGCNADLGPRWMVVYNHDGDLTGLVVDDYGCRDVRLTDNPHATPPGADDQEGAVGGILDGGQAVLDMLGLSRQK
jgi:hypothetical protein